ncbi:MAG TPA: hypothetical protein VEL76_31595 [Gemmataceae bacterium]|nr:hypothetical protein [Gemmataceae bacterium]
MNLRTWFGVALAAGALAVPPKVVPGQPAPGSAKFDELVRLIKPLAGESKWAAVPWEISLPRARERAVREDKPLLVWRAGGGDVLGRA